ncbi:MAG: glycosyltransferase family 87 protein, partial [Nitrosomonadales bacterium]|nr:glycosyltransferase family 87 protein [Nitrosomonadales bacterium]
PQFCLFLFWALIRKHWDFLKGFILIGVIGFFVTLAIFGLDSFIDYYHVLRSLSQTGESYADNQSINGMMHRMLFNGNNLEWIPTVFPPYNHTVYLTTVISSAALILLALFQKSPRDERTALLDYLVVGLAFTTASPVAWQHHYSLLIPIYGITLVTILLISDRRKKLGFIGLWLASIFLVFLPTEITYAYADTWFNFVQSSMLIGVLLILFTTYALRHEKSVGIQPSHPS